MNNLSSIHHKQFDRLYELTGNYNQATLLDKFIYWWQISTYTLDDNQIWFTRSIDQIAGESKLSRRTVERYLREFEEKGLIIRTCRLFLKKHLYVRLSDALLKILGITSDKSSKNLADLKIPTTPKDSLLLEKEPTSVKVFNHSKPTILTQTGVTDSANLAVSIYKEKYDNTINNSTVSQACNVNNLKTTPINLKTEQHQRYAIESIIGEQLEPRLKNYIKGMLTNIQTQHKVQISNPEQLFAEVVFSVLNKESQMVGIEDSHHRVNIIAKLLRNRLWSTPKGFFNHWEVGQLFKQKQKTKEHLYQQQKNAEINQEAGGYEAYKAYQDLPFSSQKEVNKPYSQSLELKQARSQLQALQLEINSEKHYLMQMVACFEKTKNNMTQTVIHGIGLKLEKLYEQQRVLSQKLGHSMAA